ncbi:MAG: prephenate dehydratase [Candidatus Omnitrophica bacterium]|nr:prephenate dehydratase [Candidatus Omnitrophota bacterium]
MLTTVAYLGPEKTNTHFAALQYFGREARYLHAPTVDQVFRMVERRESDYGVVPIENSLEGAVTHTLDRFIDYPKTLVRIWGEIEQPIRHFLITRHKAVFGRIKFVFSHPQALAQCSRWLDRKLPSAARMETSSTAEAVEHLLDRSMRSTRGVNAAIGRRDLALERGLQAVSIPLRGENRTRFLILGLGHRPLKRPSKTSLLLVLKDKPGALHDALVPFKRYGINLTKIESRPSKKKVWEYVFFIDIQGHESEPNVQQALRKLEQSAKEVRVLGSYGC